MSETIGQRLEAIRLSKGISVSDLSRDSLVHRVTISKLINSRSFYPRPYTLAAIAEALGVPVERLTDGVSTPAPKARKAVRRHAKKSAVRQ